MLLQWCCPTCKIERDSEQEIIITFRPPAEKTYEAELLFDTNLSPEALAAPIQLTGVGVSNLVCKSL